MGCCSIINCKNRHVKGSTIKFYRFPKRKSIAEKWLLYCKPSTKIHNGRVCSRHFTSSDFVEPLLQHVLLNYSPTTFRTLKPDAMPTKHIDGIDIDEIEEPNALPVFQIDNKDKKQKTSCNKAVNKNNDKSILTSTNEGSPKIFVKSTPLVKYKLVKKRNALPVFQINNKVKKHKTSDTEAINENHKIILKTTNEIAGSSKVVEKSHRKMFAIPTTQIDGTARPVTLKNVDEIEKPNALPVFQIDDKDKKQNTSNNEAISGNNNKSILTSTNEIAGSSKFLVISNVSLVRTPLVKYKLLQKPNALPVFQIDNTIKKHNTSDTEAINENNHKSILRTTNEIACSPKVFEKSHKKLFPIHTKQIDGTTRPVTLKIFDEIEKPNALPVFQIENIVKKHNTSDTEVINEMNHKSILITTNEIAGSSKVVEKSDEMISIPLVEYEQLKKTAKEYKLLQKTTKELNLLKNNLASIFTPGQIRCLMTSNMRRVRWTTEDITAAISLRNISPKGYYHLRTNVGVPLPSFSTLRKWVSKYGIKKELLDNDIK